MKEWNLGFRLNTYMSVIFGQIIVGPPGSGNNEIRIH
jgi:hypothetical protein